ncbi:transmembrane protein 198-like protein [Platysternon megacephalum]|uniref:Transmembrane protein 198-like protein n=1 Tax=Platysternon megacephalum TaxID=55544 RepID=A0A4D9E1P1_9SAUR|nr:transmembrane protein 198-like protein [Platysternon megacephalum]
MLPLLLLWGSLLFGVVSSSPTPRTLFGEITSPNYPKPYPNNNISTWDITVPKGFVVNLNFWQFDLQPSKSCLSDYVKITADKKDLGRYCGQLGSATGNHPGVREFVSKGNWMRLMFHSDFSNEENGTLIPYKGFLAYYQAVGIQCPQPVPMDQFTLIKDLQPLYRFRDYFNVSCQTGYELMEGDQKLASFSAVCQDDGTWHRPMPRCEIVNCGEPKNLTNGAFSYVSEHGNNNYQSVITYRCKEPYYRIVKGSDTYNCSAQGSWADQDGHEDIPVCLPVCGKPDNPITGIQRIIGGSTAPPGSFPWQAKIHIFGLAGGALLGDRWILTAAQTIYPKQQSSVTKTGARMSPAEVAKIEVFLGHTEVNKIHELGNHPVRNVSVHPDYDSEDENNFNGDIALIELRDPVPLGPDLLPVCLPDASNSTFYANGYMGYVSGFGVKKNFLADRLKYVSLPMGDQRSCKKWLQDKEVNGKAMVFSENMFCAGSPGGGKDTCQGDSGSVFTVQDSESERWIATGIVSWGIGCRKSYGFYTKVINYLDWIKAITGM